MNQKPLLIAVVLVALFAIVGAFWYIQKRQGDVNQPVVTNPVIDLDQNPTRVPESYPQHIEVISGTDEVWYNIPELGVRMRLNKEFAENLIYQYVHETADPR